MFQQTGAELGHRWFDEQVVFDKNFRFIKVSIFVCVISGYPLWVSLGLL